MDEDSPYDICLSDDQGTHPHIDADLLRRAVMLTLREHQSRPARIGVAVVDDVQIAAVNRQYLGHHGPTDVISFDLSEDEDDAPLEGEIIISWETAARQAAERDHSIEAEALLYTVHGVLHLIGYDDQADDDSATMHAEEDRILTLLGLGAVYGGEARGNRQQGKT